MKLRFYLRGLGVGIAVTGLVLMFIGNQKSDMTDEDIKKRASELGMVESQTLAELNEKQLESMQNNVVEEPEETALPEVTDVPEETPVPEVTEEPKATETPTEAPTATPESTATPEPTEAPTATPKPTEAPTATPKPTEAPTEAPTKAPAASKDVVIITINAGDGSGTVANRVAAAGICDSGTEFDKFLMEKGYDKTLRVGNHEISKDMTWDEIGAILCGR